VADYVISTSGAALVSVTEARRHLNISSTYDDAWLVDAVSAATRYVEDRTNRSYRQQSRRLTMRTFDDRRYVHAEGGNYFRRRVYFPRGPLVSSTGVSVTYVNAQGTTTTLPTSDYIVSDKDVPGHIVEAYNATWPDTYNVDNDVTVNYTAGTTSVPPTVKLAVNMLVAHWYRTREAATDRAFATIPYGIDALLGGEQVELYG
jgi:uncharacterized phiE125 gp8 family phage protein